MLLASIPYVWAWVSGGETHVFVGLLLNPLDGATYLAKMYQGYRGDWVFTLPYTADSGPGVYLLNTLYILLGHIARWTGLSLPLVYNLARVFSGFVLLVALAQAMDRMLPSASRKLAFVLAALGSGMGWIPFVAGQITSDIWVAEAYPFLSMYANVHFPLGLAMILWLIMPCARGGAWKYAGMAFLLAVVSPFGVVIALLPLAGMWLDTTISIVREVGITRDELVALWKREETRKLLAVVLGGLPVIIYAWVVIRSHPVLSLWDAQNITANPPWWDLLVSFSPVLFLAVIGVRAVLRGDVPNARPLMWWVGLGILLVAIPFSLQRRFLMGVFIPLAGLGAVGLMSWAGSRKRVSRRLTVLLVVLILPTQLIVLMTSVFAVTTRAPQMYLTRDEADALAWIETNTPSDVIVLAMPETGAFIPAFTGRRVQYGHPFETVNAEVQAARVRDFFADPARYPLDGDYVFAGPREGEFPVPDAWNIVYEKGDVVVYRVR